MIITFEGFGGLESLANLLPYKLRVAYTTQRLGQIYPGAILRMPGGTYIIAAYVPRNRVARRVLDAVYRRFPRLPRAYRAVPTEPVDVSAMGVV